DGGAGDSACAGGSGAEVEGRSSTGSALGGGIAAGPPAAATNGGAIRASVASQQSAFIGGQVPGVGPGRSRILRRGAARRKGPIRGAGPRPGAQAVGAKASSRGS